MSREQQHMELRDALSQITEIRMQIARTELFRGYRAAPVAFSGLLAVGAAGLQAAWIHEPGRNIGAYLWLWVGAAVISGIAATGELWLRHRRATLRVRQELIQLACEQFAPSLVAGGVLTAVLFLYARDVLWMLPGLWSILFSLGIFASYRLLPRPMFWVAVYYLFTGSLSLTFGQGENAFSPWLMAISFGGGQFLTAAILYWTMERNDVC